MHAFQIPGSSAVIDFGLWAYPITVIYLVCFINIINLIDGLDGLAAGITGMAAITLFIMFMTLQQTEAALLAAITAAVAGAFLIYNFYPASIFMGDSGSMLLGLLLGSVSLVGTTRLLSITLLIVPVIVALVPIIDTAAAIVRRLRKHESIATPDAGHIASSPAAAWLFAAQGRPAHLSVDGRSLRRHLAHVGARRDGQDGDLHSPAHRLGHYRVQDWPFPSGASAPRAW